MIAASYAVEKKNMLTYEFQREEEGLATKLFHSRVKIQDRACALTIDHWSLINAASIEMVEKLGLPRTPHPHPYLLSLGSHKLTITHQTSVHFLLGPLSHVVCCDLIPLQLVSYHLLLGKPWTQEHRVLLSRCTPPQYSVYLGKKECILQSMDINNLERRKIAEEGGR